MTAAAEERLIFTRKLPFSRPPIGTSCNLPAANITVECSRYKCSLCNATCCTHAYVRVCPQGISLGCWVKTSQLQQEAGSGGRYEMSILGNIQFFYLSFHERKLCLWWAAVDNQSCFLLSQWSSEGSLCGILFVLDTASRIRFCYSNTILFVCDAFTVYCNSYSWNLIC